MRKTRMPSTIAATSTSNKNSQFHNQRHSIGERNGREKEAVFQRQQGQHLRQRLAAVDHGEEADEEQRDGYGKLVVAQARLIWLIN